MTKSLNIITSELAGTPFDEQLEANKKKIAELIAENTKIVKSAHKNAMQTVVNLIIKFELKNEEIQNKIAETVMKIAENKTKARKKAAPKYRNPDNASQTWNGSGRSPNWATKLKEMGLLESALIPMD